jgi:hypothetical protein
MHLLSQPLIRFSCLSACSIHSLIHSHVYKIFQCHLLTHTLADTLMHLFTHSHSHLLDHSITRSPTHPCVEFANPFCQSLTQYLVHSVCIRTWCRTWARKVSVQFAWQRDVRPLTIEWSISPQRYVMERFCREGFFPSRSDPDRTENAWHHVNVETCYGEMRCLATRAWYWKTKTNAAIVWAGDRNRGQRNRIKQERESPRISQWF